MVDTQVSSLKALDIGAGYLACCQKSLILNHTDAPDVLHVHVVFFCVKTLRIKHTRGTSYPLSILGQQLRL